MAGVLGLVKGTHALVQTRFKRTEESVLISQVNRLPNVIKCILDSVQRIGELEASYFTNTAETPAKRLETENSQPTFLIT